jgi:hypothetical protein
VEKNIFLSKRQTISTGFVDPLQAIELAHFKLDGRKDNFDSDFTTHFRTTSIRNLILLKTMLA